ncbi:MAG: hypothetical protein ABDH49_05225 [Candidatus Hydrothermales bacterium]
MLKFKFQQLEFEILKKSGIILIFFIYFSLCKKPPEPIIEKEFSLILEYPLKGYSQGLFLKDSLLFVANGQGGLVILNISHLPDSIILLSQKETGYNAKSIHVKDSFAFLGFDDINRKGIWVYDIKNLKNPKLITSDEGVSYVYDISSPPQDTHFLYLASGYFYYIEDLSGLPYYLSFVKRYHPPGKVRGIYSDENYVYLACEQMGVVIFPALIPNVPDSEAIISWIDTPNNARDIFVKDNKIFVADGYGGLVIIEISDIKNPTVLSRISLPGYSQKIDGDGNMVYLACGSSGVIGVDIKNIMEPKVYAVYRTSYAYDLEINEEYIFVADRDKGIIVLSKEVE